MNKFFLTLTLAVATLSQAQQVAKLGVPDAVQSETAPVPQDREKAIALLCGEIDRLYARNKWGAARCDGIKFEVLGWSVQGRPILMFKARGKGSSRQTASLKQTLVQCGIHGDELPSLHMCMSLIHEIQDGKRGLHPGQVLAVQPLLNPDGMFAAKPTRFNAHGVDINRNFPTRNWAKEALASWKIKDRQDPRKFPGRAANSEPEAQVIVNYINREKPQKVISVHTPLGFLDLDAKSGNRDRERRAHYLAVNIVANAGNYRFKTFGVYPGSLGNFSGRERAIPVYTLELPSNDNRKPTVDSYWKKFRVGLWRAIDFDMDTGEFTSGDED